MGVLMRKKNGFISISAIYSFFVVFLLILLIILNSYINNRASFDLYKDYIKNNVAEKYVNSLGNSKKLSDEIISLYTSYGKTNWNTRNWYIEKKNNDYYFVGSTPPNFVCLSSDPKDNCQVDFSNLYRIIGVFSPNTHKSPDFNKTSDYLVRLVKYSPFTTLDYDGVDDFLKRDDYVDTHFNAKTKTFIAKTRWTTFKNNSAEVKFDAMRNNEIGTTASNASYVGLLTVSDIGFTTGEFSEPNTINCKPSTLNVNNLSGIATNGQHTGCESYGWNISAQRLYNSTSDGKGYIINSEGNIVIDDENLVLNVRPVIYLNPDVVILKGTGSQDNPYMLNVYPTEDLSE